MDDEDGMESFSIDDRDLDYALNPRRHFQSKEQALYGMWAADSDDEDPADGSRRDRRNRKPNYSGPVNFVSGGIKQGSSLAEEKKKDEEEEIEMDFSRPSFTAPQPKKPKQTGANVFAGMRMASGSAAPDPTKFADWAKHGKGSVIMNMMKSMGYEHGKGLGKEGQGIVEPVKAAVRAGRGAVGAYGKEVTGPKFGESAADAQRRMADEGAGGVEEDEGPARPLPKGAWKKNAKVKVTYRTIDDVMADESSIGMRAAKHSGEKVIDMTGPEQRVYTGYEALSMKSVRAEADETKKFDIPELSHNLNLIIDLTEDDIRKANNALNRLENSATALRYDLKLARESLQKEEEELNRMQQVYDLLDSLKAKSTSMDAFKAAFRRLRSEYAAEYTLLELDKVAVPCILPQIKELFVRWRPLEKDQYALHYDLMEEWKEILEPPATSQSIFRANTSMGVGGGLVNDRLAAFDRLMWDGWMPPVRSAVLRWDPRDQLEDMRRLVETWLPIMPSWMRDKFIDQLLIPRITARVDEWDPTKDTVPIHQWLVPWTDIMGDRLLPVFSPIRQKLAKALRHWNSKDTSAFFILNPWRDVWAPATMAAFVQQNIVPRLREGLIKMNLDPSAQATYAEYTACITWMLPDGLIAPDVIAELLSTTFFPRWYETLCFWLDSPMCDKGQVKQWLVEWNSRVPPVLMAFPALKEHLRRGMLALAGQRPPPLIGASTSSTVPNPLLTAPPPPSAVPRPVDAQLSLKDVLEITAQRRGLEYMPQPNRIREGKQVYWFGTQSIYVDRGLVFCLDIKTIEWRPISIDDLLAIA